MAFNIESGLIDIAAITSLVGATTAESLILGSRGAAGLPWAAMSCFGSFYVVKACVAASLPAWLRDAMGLDSPLCRATLGASSPLDHRSMLKVRPETPVGISVDPGSEIAKSSINCIYAFDEYTAGIVRSCPSFQHGEAPRVFAYARDGPKADPRRDWLAVAATAVKIAETVVLSQHAGWQLTLTSTISWAFFFLAACSLQALGISRELRNLPSNSRFRHDIIAGDFPTAHGPGKEIKILFGVPMNVRRHLAWRLVWGIGGMVCFCATVATYILLSKRMTTRQFYIWAAFQGIWLMMRSVYFHFALFTDGRPCQVVEQEVTNQRYRLLSFASGLSRHLAKLHPRTAESYLSDLHEALEIQTYINSAGFNWGRRLGDETPFEPPPPTFSEQNNAFVDIEILAVIGDTMLYSIAWIYGYDISAFDLYDSCLVVVKVTEKTFLVPATRVCSGNITYVKAHPAEAGPDEMPQFIPKMGPCRAEDNGWVFWIPLGPNRWLYVLCGLDFLGQQCGEILDNAEVTRRLMLGTLWVSIKHSDEIQDSTKKAGIVGRILMFYFLGEEECAHLPDLETFGRNS